MHIELKGLKRHLQKLSFDGTLINLIDVARSATNRPIFDIDYARLWAPYCDGFELDLAKISSVTMSNNQYELLNQISHEVTDLTIKKLTLSTWLETTYAWITQSLTSYALDSNFMIQVSTALETIKYFAHLILNATSE